MEITNNKLDASKDGSGIGVWVSEVAWRDFYQHVLAAFPRVSMGRAFNLKFEDIIWQEDEEALQKWKDGKTGFPIVDAGMRALKEQGYMHVSRLARAGDWVEVEVRVGWTDFFDRTEPLEDDCCHVPHQGTSPLRHVFACPPVVCSC